MLVQGTCGMNSIEAIPRLRGEAAAEGALQGLQL